MAGLYTSAGFGVLMCDYIGMGSDWKNYHPYVLFPEPNALNTINALNNISGYIKDLYGGGKISLYVAGYS